MRLPILILLAFAANADAETITFTGEVSAGQAYTHEFTKGLALYLNPSRALEGWNIEVVPTEPQRIECSEYAGMATPPYHFENDRYLDTSYGVPAQEAVKRSPRTFEFVTNCADALVQSELVDLQIYSSALSPKAVEERIRALRKPRLGQGRLDILESRVTPGKLVPGSDKRETGAIDWIRFRVQITLP